MKVSNVTKLLTLVHLYRDSRHGYEIMDSIEEQTGERPSSSQIYPFLNKLKDEGLVEVEETGNRKKKVYKLTDEGTTYVESKLEMFSEVISSTIEKDLTACAHCGCKVYEGGYEEKVGDRKLKFCCRHCAESYKN